MNSAVIIYGLFLFLSSLLLHVVIWRLKTPWLSSFMLILLLLGLPLVLGLAVMVDIGGLQEFVGLNAIEAAEVLLLQIALAGAYIAGYPAVRAVSPSLDILVMISSIPGRRMTRDELLKRYTAARVVTARLDDLVEYRFLIKKDDRFTVSPASRWIVRTFRFYRRMLGLPSGGG